MKRVTVEFLLLGQQLHSKHDAPLHRHGTWNKHTTAFEISFSGLLHDTGMAEANQAVTVLTERIRAGWKWLKSMASGVNIMSATLPQQTYFSICKIDSITNLPPSDITVLNEHSTQYLKHTKSPIHVTYIHTESILYLKTIYINIEKNTNLTLLAIY